MFTENQEQCLNPSYPTQRKQGDSGVEGWSGGGVVEAVIISVIVYSLLGDGVLAIAGPRVVHTRFRKSPVTDLQL